MCDEAGIYNCTSLAIGFIYVWLCSPQAIIIINQVLRIIKNAVKSDVETGRI